MFISKYRSKLWESSVQCKINVLTLSITTNVSITADDDEYMCGDETTCGVEEEDQSISMLRRRMVEEMVIIS